MIKKIILSAALIFCLFPLSANAEESSSLSLIPYGEFYTLEDNETLSILNSSEDELKSYTEENNVCFLAVNKDNTKQIKITSSVTDFSNSVVNISNLSDDKISSLSEDITGFKGISGEIIKKNSQKFIKLELKSEDSGGEYILTQFITVADKKTIVLSFYTLKGENTDYIEKSFETLEYSGFLKETVKNTGLKPIIIIALILFILLALFISYTIIRDIKFQEEREKNL